MILSRIVGEDRMGTRNSIVCLLMFPSSSPFEEEVVVKVGAVEN